jgi:hypothetical protein
MVGFKMDDMHSHPRNHEEKIDWKWEGSTQKCSVWLCTLVPIRISVDIHKVSREVCGVVQALLLIPTLPLLQFRLKTLFGSFLGHETKDVDVDFLLKIKRSQEFTLETKLYYMLTHAQDAQSL